MSSQSIRFTAAIALSAFITIQSQQLTQCGDAVYDFCTVQYNANNKPFYYYCDSNHNLQNTFTLPVECGGSAATQLVYCGDARYTPCETQYDANGKVFYYYCDTNNNLQNTITLPSTCNGISINATSSTQPITGVSIVTAASTATTTGSTESDSSDTAVTSNTNNGSNTGTAISYGSTGTSATTTAATSSSTESTGPTSAFDNTGATSASSTGSSSGTGFSPNSTTISPTSTVFGNGGSIATSTAGTTGISGNTPVTTAGVVTGTNSAPTSAVCSTTPTSATITVSSTTTSSTSGTTTVASTTSAPATVTSTTGVKPTSISATGSSTATASTNTATVYTVVSTIYLSTTCPINVTAVIDDVAAQLNISTTDITDVTDSCEIQHTVVKAFTISRHHFEAMNVSDVSVSCTILAGTETQAQQLSSAVQNVTTVDGITVTSVDSTVDTNGVPVTTAPTSTGVITTTAAGTTGSATTASTTAATTPTTLSCPCEYGTVEGCAQRVYFDGVTEYVSVPYCGLTFQQDPYHLAEGNSPSPITSYYSNTTFTVVDINMNYVTSTDTTGLSFNAFDTNSGPMSQTAITDITTNPATYNVTYTQAQNFDSTAINAVVLLNQGRATLQINYIDIILYSYVPPTTAPTSATTTTAAPVTPSASATTSADTVASTTTASGCQCTATSTGCTQTVNFNSTTTSQSYCGLIFSAPPYSTTKPINIYPSSSETFAISSINMQLLNTATTKTGSFYAIDQAGNYEEIAYTVTSTPDTYDLHWNIVNPTQLVLFSIGYAQNTNSFPTLQINNMTSTLYTAALSAHAYSSVCDCTPTIAGCTQTAVFNANTYTSSPFCGMAIRGIPYDVSGAVVFSNNSANAFIDITTMNIQLYGPSLTPTSNGAATTTLNILVQDVYGNQQTSTIQTFIVPANYPIDTGSLDPTQIVSVAMQAAAAGTTYFNFQINRLDVTLYEL